MKKTGHIFLILSFLYSACILALGGWWLFLILKYGEQVATITGQGQGEKVLKMVKWEGGTFLTLLILLSASLLALYFKDQRKTRGLQAFFASMTHELKTPLASIKLQSEVLAEELEDVDNQRVKTLVQRLLQDTGKMETQMDKILQLSRLEGGGILHLKPSNLSDIWEKSLKQWGHELSVQGEIPKEMMILADEFALSLVFRNLFENTTNHAKTQKVMIDIVDNGHQLKMIYRDGGLFKGDGQKLGTLFYKHNSQRGTGIGLYLIKKLMTAMRGEVSFKGLPEFSTTLTFQQGRPS